MSNDAKLGLVAGLGLVLVIAVVFFRKEPPAAPAVPAAAASVQPATPPPPPPRPVKGRPSSARRHVVEAGETLHTLARRYYNDNARSVDIFLANREVLASPEELAPGTVLVIPDMPEEGGGR
jgi:nucleoid-associated protein YgaU